MTERALIDRFREVALEEQIALLDSDAGKFRPLYENMQAIDAELRGRGSAARAALLTLLDDDNLRVRYEAAVRCLGIAPARARRVLGEIVASCKMPEAGDAGMTLLNLERGVFAPT
ncbi:MAG TPA: DUF2019 domain-containing protein [Micropepsaceae bacterium]|nr:DUF2019 domain-containing protein [Micropepsaceae bacterium]